MIIFYDAIIYACMLAVLCVGLTLTYKITKIPNFAHASFAILGMYMALLLSKGFGYDVYVALPFAFAVSGGVSLFLYYGVIRILQQKNSSLLSLIFVTLAFDIFMIGILNIFADGVTNTFHVTSRDFTLRSQDALFFDLPAVLFVSVIVLAALVIGLYFLLYRTKFGMQMRASIENPLLAKSFGINTEKVFCASWFLSGGLAGIAGVFMSLWFQGDPGLAAIMLPSIFAGSIVGGFTSIYGAILGGLLVGMSEILGTTVLSDVLGYWVLQYRPLIPFITMIITLLILPNGIAHLITTRWSKRHAKL